MNVRGGEADKPWPCSTCPERFSKQFILNKHESGHGGSYNCQFCGAPFLTKVTRLHHERRQHPRNGLLNLAPTPTDPLEEGEEEVSLVDPLAEVETLTVKVDPMDVFLDIKPIEESPRTAHKRGRGDVTEEGWKRQRHEGPVQKGARWSLDELNYLAKKTVLSSKKYKCPNCPKMFATKHLHTQHLGAMQDGVPCGKFICVKCEVPFSNSAFTKHMALHENGKERVRVKQQEGVLKCSTCTESFTTGQGLKAHERGHGGSYNCRFCDAPFFKQCNRVSHERRHHYKIPENSVTINSTPGKSTKREIGVEIVGNNGPMDEENENDPLGEVSVNFEPIDVVKQEIDLDIGNFYQPIEEDEEALVDPLAEVEEVSIKVEPMDILDIKPEVEEPNYSSIDESSMWEVLL